jgi:hypothetical protein
MMIPRPGIIAAAARWLHRHTKSNWSERLFFKMGYFPPPDFYGVAESYDAREGVWYDISGHNHHMVASEGQRPTIREVEDNNAARGEMNDSIEINPAVQGMPARYEVEVGADIKKGDAVINVQGVLLPASNGSYVLFGIAKRDMERGEKIVIGSV